MKSFQYTRLATYIGILFFLGSLIGLPFVAKAQLPAGVSFPGYPLNISYAPAMDTAPNSWNIEQTTPDVDDMDIIMRLPSHNLQWTVAPSTKFGSNVTRIAVGAWYPTGGSRAESFATSISGLVAGLSYTYSFEATAGIIANIVGSDATSLTLGLYFNGTLVASQVLNVGENATRRYFTFTAPAASGNLSIGVVSAVGGNQGNNPWYQIGGGTGQFAITCAAGNTAPSVNSSITNNCPTTTVNLNNAHTGTAPAGTTIQWFTDNAHTNAVATPTASGAGTYYAFYYDNTNNCYSPASQAVTATITQCCAANAGTITRQ